MTRSTGDHAPGHVATKGSARSGANLQRSAVGKALLRTVPFLGLRDFLACIDRVNVGIAALPMNGDSRLGDATFSLVGGAFFNENVKVAPGEGSEFSGCSLAPTRGQASACESLT